MTFLVSSFRGGFVLSGAAGEVYVYDLDGKLIGHRIGGMYTAPLPDGDRFALSDRNGLHVFDPRGALEPIASDAAFANAWPLFRDGVLYVRRGTHQQPEWFNLSHP